MLDGQNQARIPDGPRLRLWQPKEARACSLHLHSTHQLLHARLQLLQCQKRRVGCTRTFPRLMASTTVVRTLVGLRPWDRLSKDGLHRRRTSQCPRLASQPWPRSFRKHAEEDRVRREQIQLPDLASTGKVASKYIVTHCIVRTW